MKKSRWWSIPLASMGLVLGTAVMGLPASGQTGEESQFLLQDHGGVNITRGLDQGKNFESTLAPEDEEAEAPAVEPEPEKETSTASRTTGGIIVHRPGGTGTAAKRLTGTQRKANIPTTKAGVSTSQNIPVHRAGGSDSSKIRTHKAGGSDSSKIPTHRAGGSDSSKIRVHRAGGS